MRQAKPCVQKVSKISACRGLVMLMLVAVVANDLEQLEAFRILILKWATNTATAQLVAHGFLEKVNTATALDQCMGTK